MATRKRIPEISFPDSTDDTTATILGQNILFIGIHYDQSPANPCKEWDGFGEIRSLSHRHIDSIDRDEAVALIKSDPDVIPLSYFEHGNSLWMVKDLPAPAGVEFEWDGVRFAGIWIPDRCVRESYMGQDGLSRRDWMVQQAKSACTTYTQWANGEVYGYIVDVYKARKGDFGDVVTDHDYYDHHTPIEEDSCWGYYGWEDALGETTRVVKSTLKTLGYSRRAIAAALKETVAA